LYSRIINFEMTFFRLSTFSVFGYSAFFIGRKCWYTIKDTDNIITEKQWRTKRTKDLNVKYRLWPKINKNNFLNRFSSKYTKKP